jgi:thiol:disulfide interchange protein DsbD
VSYGYEHEVLLPVEIRVPPTLPSDEVRLTARVSWLECEEVCLPGKAELVLALPVQTNPAPSPAAALFEKTRTRIPTKDPAWGVSATSGEGNIALAVNPPQGTTLDEAYFYPVTRRVIDYSKPQALGAFDGGHLLELPRHPRGKTVETLEGVLVGRTAKGTVALQVDVTLAARPAAGGVGVGVTKDGDQPGSR